MDVPEAERSEIQSVIERPRSGNYAEQVFRGHRDIVVIASKSAGNRSVWAMKRLPGQAEQSRGDGDYLLAALMAAALFSAAGYWRRALRFAAVFQRSSLDYLNCKRTLDMDFRNAATSWSNQHRYQRNGADAKGFGSPGAARKTGYARQGGWWRESLMKCGIRSTASGFPSSCCHTGLAQTN